MQSYYNICLLEKYSFVKMSDRYWIEAGNIDQLGHREHQWHP